MAQGIGAAPLTRVMIVDDSAVIRAATTKILEADPSIRVVARAEHGRAALAAQKLHDIDVVVLDIEMPVMDGLTVLPLLLEKDPSVRVVVASTLTDRGAEISLRALRLGAADYVPKPSAMQVAGDARYGEELRAKVLGLGRQRRAGRPAERGAARRDPAGFQAAPLPANPPAAPLPAGRPAPKKRPLLLAVGSSTGGPKALFTLFQSLPAKLAVPVVMTQHMPAAFIPILAEHITKLGGMRCVPAADGANLSAGTITIAPGDRHMLVKREGAGLVTRLSDTPPEHYCRPSVNPMLRSAAEAVDGRVLVVMLTGMGSDGLEGTRMVIEKGGAALAQDEATSVVWGMPGAITREGLPHAVLPLPKLGEKIMSIMGLPA